MSLITGTKLSELINSGKKSQIFVEPILSDSQLGAVSLDLRLGYDFLVSVQSRNPSIQVGYGGESSEPKQFFQSTRRDIGETFLLHPSQTVLATSLEYVGLPSNVYADVFSRSSYRRLGINTSSMFQPGFRGVISLELFNHSNVPVELIVGSRIVQARFFKISNNEGYLRNGPRRKYIGNVRPVASRAERDDDLRNLAEISSNSWS